MKNFWADKRVLITGGAGYLAYSLLSLLKDKARSTDSGQAASIVRLDRPGAVFFPITGNTTITEVTADVRNPSVWEPLIKDVDVIFHLAAQTSAARADADPDEDLAVNVTPVIALINTCRQMRVVPSVVFAGTATECGLTASFPVNETVPDYPITTYDHHKLAAENALKETDRQGILRAVTLRLANLYGPGPRSGSADRGILNLMIRRALAGEPLTVYGAGDYVRDYLFVEDAARAFLAAAENMESVHGGHFVIGTGAGHTIKEAFELVAERTALRTGRRVDVKQIEPPSPLPTIETRNFTADTTQFKKQTGWRAQVDLKTGIDQTIEFYEEVH